MSAGGLIRHVAAIALHTFTEARRQRLLGPLVILAVIIFLSALLLPTDGTAEGRVRLILGVCSQVTALFVGVLTVLLAARTLSREIEQKTVYCLASKPVSHTAQVLGKFAGVVMTAAVAAGLLAVATWIVVQYVFARETTHGEVFAATEFERIHGEEPTDEQRAWLLEREVLLSKDPIPPADFDRDPELPQAIFLVPGVGRRAPESRYRVRFRVPASAGRWRDLALYLRINAGIQSSFPVDVIFEDPGSGERIERLRVTALGGRPQTVYFPARLAASGEVLVTLVNNPEYELVDFIRVLRPRELPDGRIRYGSVVLGVPSHGLASSLLRGTVLLLAQMALLAAATVLASTSMSFAVSVTVGAFVAFVGHIGPFVIDVLANEQRQLAALAARGVEDAGASAVSHVGQYAMDALTWILPDFTTYSGVDFITQATSIPGLLILKGVVYLALLRGVPCLALACWVYRRRELAA